MRSTYYVLYLLARLHVRQREEGSLHFNSAVSMSLSDDVRLNKVINTYSFCMTAKIAGAYIDFPAQRLINLEIPVLIRSLESSNFELG